MATPAITPVSQSPARRAWRRFRSNRLGYRCLLIFAVLFGVSLLAEVLSNDKPLAARYNGQWYAPVLQTLPETTFGGDFPTPTDYLDPQIRANLAKPGNFAVFPPNAYHHGTINYFAKEPAPSAPSSDNLLGTDDRGRDIAQGSIVRAEGGAAEFDDGWLVCGHCASDGFRGSLWISLRSR